jgi:hypothetical protein
MFELGSKTNWLFPNLGIIEVKRTELFPKFTVQINELFIDKLCSQSEMNIIILKLHISEAKQTGLFLNLAI